MAEYQTILVRVSGPDRPGISAALLTLLANAGADVEDIEQVVIRRQLTLGMLIDVPHGRDLLKELLLFAWEQRLEVDFDVVDSVPTPREIGHVVTVLGATLSPAELASVTNAIAAAEGNISRIVRLSRYPVFSYELLVRGGDREMLRDGLLTVAAENPRLDIAIQREGLGRRAKRLVMMDVDSTLIQDEVIDLLAAEAGVLGEVQELTKRAMAGELDFEAALRQRVALLAGLEEAAVETARRKLRLTPGARTFVRTLHRLGMTTAIVSGGFDVFTDPLKDELGLDHAFANTLEFADGMLTGRLVGPIVDRARKAELLTDVAAAAGVSLEQTVAIGDGANDLDMLAAAGLGIAFNAKPVVAEAADTAVSVPYLDAILFLLGVSREEVEEADDADPPGPPLS